MPQKPNLADLPPLTPDADREKNKNAPKDTIKEMTTKPTAPVP
jgi:hypothetical protein